MTKRGVIARQSTLALGTLSTYRSETIPKRIRAKPFETAATTMHVKIYSWNWNDFKIYSIFVITTKHTLPVKIKGQTRQWNRRLFSNAKPTEPTFPGISSSESGVDVRGSVSDLRSTMTRSRGLVPTIGIKSSSSSAIVDDVSESFLGYS